MKLREWPDLTATSEPVTNGTSTADKDAEGAMETDEATEAPSEAKTSEPMTTTDDNQVCSLWCSEWRDTFSSSVLS